MKIVKSIFVLIYFFAPLVVLPYLAYKEQNWYILAGILFSYLGVAISAYKPQLLIIFIIFTVGFWLKAGFNLHQYVTLFFLCMICEFICYQIANKYDNLLDKKNNPEKYKEFSEIEFQINNELETYKLNHPNEPITPQIIDEIKNKIFYSRALDNLKK